MDLLVSTTASKLTGPRTCSMSVRDGTGCCARLYPGVQYEAVKCIIVHVVLEKGAISGSKANSRMEAADVEAAHLAPRRLADCGPTSSPPQGSGGVTWRPPNKFWPTQQHSLTPTCCGKQGERPSEEARFKDSLAWPNNRGEGTRGREVCMHALKWQKTQAGTRAHASPPSTQR